jgi:REP element-mobilizing transposase RayT
MGGTTPTLIVTNEDARMRVAISIVLPNTNHIFCMWHIMEKLPEKIDAHLLKDDEFRKMINSCVWGSEAIEEFETKWQAWITKYHLEKNEWLVGRYHICKSWIPAYFSDI